MSSNDINMFNFESEVTFSKRRKCGEIFLSGNKIILVCKYCDNSSESIDKFENHIFTNHFSMCSQEPLDEPENIEESNQQEKNCSTSKKCESNITPICAKRISPNLFQINYKKFHQKRSEITKKLFEKTKQSDFMYNKTQEASFLDNETDIDDQIFLHGNKKVVTSSEKEQNNEKSQQDTGANTFNVPSNENVRQNCDEITRLKEIEYLSKINADSKSQLDSLYLEDHEMIECKDDSFSSGLFDKDKDFLDLENESNISESYHFPYNKYYTKNHEGRQLEKLHGYGNEKEYKNCNT